MQGAANAYERQALVSEGADTLTDAGLYDESDALLKTELTRSSTPYYFMSGLAANARRARRQGRGARLVPQGL